jgi:hypothetical protein
MDKRSCFLMGALFLSLVLFFAGCIQGGMDQKPVPAKSSPETTHMSTIPPTTTIPKEISFSEESIPYAGSVVNAAVVGGKLLYAVRNAGGTTLVYGGSEYARESRVVGVLSDVGGKIAYTVTLGMDEDGKSIIIFDGKEVGREYFGVDYPTDIGGKLAYLAYQPQEGNMKSFVVCDGAEIGKEYDNVASLSSAGGTPLFVAAKGDKKYVVYNGKELGGEYSSVSSPIEVNGAIAFIASRGDAGDRKTFVVYDGAESGAGYYGVEGLASVNGKLAYLASSDGNGWFLVYDGKEIQGDYSYAKNPVGLDRMIAYAAGSSGNAKTTEYIIYSGKKSQEYDLVKGPFVIGEKIWFMGSRGGQWYIVRQD